MTRVPEKSELPANALKTVLLGAGLMCSAGLAAVSLQTSNGVWLGWVMLIPLLLAIRILSPARALIAGSFWGICLFAFASLAGVGFEPSIGALLNLATMPAAYAYMGSLITRRKGFSPLMLGLGWVGLEIALQPLGIQNGLLAGSLSHSLFVRTIGYLAGSVVVAFVVVYVNASILSMLTSATSVPGGSRRAPRSHGAEPRLSIPEVPAFLLRFLRTTHARAPPAR